MAAPVARFDSDWPVVGDFSLDSELPQKGHLVSAELLLDDDPDRSSFSPADSDAFRSFRSFRSTEDLVKDFDEKLSVCFQNYEATTESFSPVTVISEDTVLETDEIWSALTSKFGHVMPVDWKRSRTRFLHIPVFNLEDTPRNRDVTAEPLDDEELREQLDTHSIIVSSLAEEPLFTAEQVIEELEEMMQDSPNMDTGQDPSQSYLSMMSLGVLRSNFSPGFKERVRVLSVAELNERLEGTETVIRRLSEELVVHLALRDELEFEKEVKNSFISALIDVQNRQKEHREMLKKNKKLKAGAGTSQGYTSRFRVNRLSSVIQNSFWQKFGSGCPDKQFLTTVIPYEKKGCPPSIQDLQILTKILLAMRDESDKVPSLLTDYILKVLCPT
ncbi:fasciculation and elongation protein zeta-2 isoform X2 [Thalassophryne amazonica]|uniref:fasciculation and elongation protein zeta-2 isoform X2 n=1 Tax=Thalassophryne amazonica TaxID=390379 RepID=UPI0014726276|nr:fasciculation and elongation protein zeta-2 isoform X2 [Thalassophryne amazonica]